MRGMVEYVKRPITLFAQEFRSLGLSIKDIGKLPEIKIIP